MTDMPLVRKQSVKHYQKRIAIFAAITFFLSAIVYGLMLSHKLRGTLALMWTPAVSALLTQLIFQKNVRGLGWTWGRTRYQLLSIALPFTAALVVYGVAWAAWSESLDLSRATVVLGRMYHLDVDSPYLAAALLLIMSVTAGLVLSSLTALGEEIGWRGFLVPELAKVTTFSKTALLSGAMWAVWHYPALLLLGYAKGILFWYGMMCFTFTALGASYAAAWLRLKSGSVWTGMFLHASHNTFVQAFFDPLTMNGGTTRWVTGEVGAGLAVCYAIVAYVCWKKRRVLPKGGSDSR